MPSIILRTRVENQAGKKLAQEPREASCANRAISSYNQRQQQIEQPRCAAPEPASQCVRSAAQRPSIGLSDRAAERVRSAIARSSATVNRVPREIVRPAALRDGGARVVILRDERGEE